MLYGPHHITSVSLISRSNKSPRMLTCEIINYQIFFKRFPFLQNKSVYWHRLIMTLNILKVSLKACWIWNDRYLNTGYNKVLTDPISWHLAFANCRFFPNFVRLFDRNLCFTGLSARRAYLESIFCQCHVILWDRNYFLPIFSTLSTFLFTLFTFHVVSCTASQVF